MMFFLDSSNPAEVAELFKTGVLSGVTTNPLIISKEMPGAELRQTIMEILAVTHGPVSVELTSERFEEMIDEAKQYHAWNDRIVIKVPVNIVGLRVIHELSYMNVSVNATCIMTPMQALMAALAGATYVSLFHGRIKDMGIDAGGAMREARETLERAGKIYTEIIAGSIRQAGDVAEAIVGGAHIVTVPPKILRQMVHHPRTEETIREFADAWKAHEESCKR